MEDKNKIWMLFAKKLSGEATSSELSEFEKIREANPDLDFYFEFFLRLWKQPKEINGAKIDHCYKSLAERLFKGELKLSSSNRVIIEKFKFDICDN